MIGCYAMRAGLIGLVLAATGAFAGDLTDRLMAPGLFADAPVGEILRYAHKRTLPGQPAGTEPAGKANGVSLPAAVVDGTVILVREPEADKLALRLSEPDHPIRTVAEFTLGAPNPVLMFHLENIVRVMAVETGGSPFYIRNRIRDALAASPAGVVEGGRASIALRPFAKDPQAGRMGRFAALSLTIIYVPDQPARILELLADTGQGPGEYTERLNLVGAE